MARDFAEKIKSATLIKALNKELARVSLSDDTMIEKIDRELNKKVVAPASAAIG